jgi:hypothetical protein
MALLLEFSLENLKTYKSRLREGAMINIKRLQTDRAIRVVA